MLEGGIFPGYRALLNFLWRGGYAKWMWRYKKTPVGGPGSVAACIRTLREGVRMQLGKLV